ncbi:MAG: ribosomal protein L7/L12 [Lachnospiraceae bacterium]|nr:ribosomal protein L7/L12 [Lachnospiraceae bacterium]
MLYTVKLLSFNNDEILMIDLCMTLCGLDMNSAAHCVDHMPSVLIKNVDESKVEELKREFEAAGAVLQVISADEEAAMDPEDSVPVSNNTTIEETPVVNNPQTEYIDYSGYTETEEEETASVYDDFAMDSGEYDNYYQEDNSQQQEYVEDNQYQEQYSDEQQYTEEYTEYAGDEQTEEYQEQSTEYVQQPEPQSVVTMNEPEEEPPKEEPKEENVMPSYCPMCGSAFISVKKSSGFFGGGRVKYICDACKHKF